MTETSNIKPCAIDDATLDVIKEAFVGSDINGDGLVSIYELREMFQDIGQWTDEEFEALFDAADVNGDGMLQWEEFVSWILGTPVVAAKVVEPAAAKGQSTDASPAEEPKTPAA